MAFNGSGSTTYPGGIARMNTTADAQATGLLGGGLDSGLMGLISQKANDAAAERALRLKMMQAQYNKTLNPLVARGSGLTAARPDSYSQAMGLAQTQADVAGVQSRGRTRDFMDTKNLLDANTTDMYGVRQADTNPYFQNFTAAQALQTGQQFPNGWDVYAQLASGGKPTKEQTERATIQDARSAARGW